MTTTKTSEVETALAQSPAVAAPAPARAPGFPDCPRDANGRFLPGAPGRQPGQRNLLSGRVARAILRDFQAYEDELLPRMRRWFLPQYMQLIAKLLPKNGAEGLDASDIAALREALAAAEAAPGAEAG